MTPPPPNRRAELDAWLTRVLGTRLPAPVSVAAAVSMPPPGPPPAPFGQGQPRSGLAITPRQPTAPTVKVTGAGGKTIEIAQAADGRVTFTAPPPPVREITFSGGGGKGAALPGAVRALENAGVLKDVTLVTGASVGSMTAALVATGITAEEFAEIGNDPTLAATIKEGRHIGAAIFGGGLSGEGLEDLVRAKMNGSLRKRMLDYLQAQTAAGQPVDPVVARIARKLADGDKGPTFGDLRALSKVIPSIKEVAISGTFLGTVDPDTGEVDPQARPQLAIFDADTQPDMEVALAVHASAALPPVFKPVDVPLASGIVGRFEDGGVLNNAPTSDSIGRDRGLDPMPDKGCMTFVFEEEAAHEILAGEATPRRDRLADFISGANNSAAEYAKNRALADRPEDVVMVPLVFTVPPTRQGGKGQTKDFSTLLGGTTNFDMPLDDRLTLQAMTDDATTAHLLKRQAPRPREFDSTAQMFACLPRADLAALAASGFAGAADALAFRDRASALVGAIVARLQALSHGAPIIPARDPSILAAFAELDRLCDGQPDRQGFVAREMNRSGELDGLIAAVRKDARLTDNAALQASIVVQDAVLARAHARQVLVELIYPKLVKLDPDSSGGELLRQVDDRLRRVRSPADFNDAIGLAIAHFRKKFDPLGVNGHKAFAVALEAQRMKVSG